MTKDLPTPFDGIPVLGLGENGQPPAERLKDPKTLRDIFTQAREDDRLNALNRAECQDLLDGGTPYRESDLIDAGAPQTTNLNFGGAADRLEKAMAPYYRMIQSTDNMVSVKTRYGAQEDRSYYEQVLSEEITRLYRGSRQWVTQTAQLIQKFLWDAVGIGYFRDKRDFRYRSAGLGQFFFPRGCSTDENEHEILTASDTMGVAGRNSMWEKIKNAPDGATEINGWNVAAVKRAIKKASTDSAYQDWEKLMEEVKNNDLCVANKLKEVKVVHGFVQEFDGTVSHYITTEDSCKEAGQEEEKFLYTCRNYFKTVNQCLVLFTYGLGTNAKLHGIRGLGYKIYPFEQQVNRSTGRMVDAAGMASSFVLQATGTDADYSNAGYQMIGNAAILDPNFAVAPVTFPDLTKAVMPVIELMRSMRNERTSGYTADGVFDGDQRKTKFEISAGLEQNAELSDVEQDFFFLPFDTLMQESVRRAADPGYLDIDPGGPEIRDLKLRIVQRGVPLEAFYQIDIKATHVVRGIGGGSASARTLALNSLQELYPRMDDVGKANYDWALASSRVGVTMAAEFVPRNGAPRTTIDTQIAILQNPHLLDGEEIPVLGTDRHLAHAREHVKPLMEMAQMIELGQMESIEAASYNPLYAHAVEHVSMATGDPATEEEVAALNEILQRIGEHISNGLKEAEAAAEEQGQQEQGPSVEDQAKLQKAQADIDIAREKNAAKIALDQENSAAKIAIADSVAAAKIRRDNFSAKSKAAQAKKMPTKKAAKKTAK